MELQRNILHGLSATFLLLLFQLSSASITGGHTGPFMTSDVNEVAGKSFDYIVVGGGTSGCPLVATLSKSYSVLLVERGGSPYGNHLIENESSMGFYNVPTNEPAYFVEPFVSEEGVPNVRGRVLGGTTAINGGFYGRAGEDFIEKAGWDGELVKDAYEWVESKVVFKPYELIPWQSVVKEAFVEAGVTPFNGYTLDHVEGTKIGGRIFDENGKRHSAADLLMSGDCKRITVLLNATVQNVIIEHAGDGQRPRAHGVRFIKSHSTNSDDVYEVYLNQPKRTGSWGDVILSAGALGSPQILMLSGIGPHEHLKHFNIPPLIHTTQVGNGIQDNPGLAVVMNMSQALHKQSAGGPQVEGVANGFRIIIGSVTAPISVNVTVKGIVAKVANPLSRGVLRLNSTDPKQNPLVKFNYFVEESDLDECVEVARLIERVARTKSVEMYLGRKQSRIVTRGGSIKEKLKEFCKKNMMSYSHYHGGCLVGSVVDEDYKVFGVEGLRVIDGSTLLDSPGTNPMATLMMLGRYQGLKMLKERHGHRKRESSVIKLEEISIGVTDLEDDEL